MRCKKRPSELLLHLLGSSRAQHPCPRGFSGVPPILGAVGRGPFSSVYVWSELWELSAAQSFGLCSTGHGDQGHVLGRTIVFNVFRRICTLQLLISARLVLGNRAVLVGRGCQGPRIAQPSCVQVLCPRRAAEASAAPGMVHPDGLLGSILPTSTVLSSLTFRV